jgi:hypothetical protein
MRDDKYFGGHGGAEERGSGETSYNILYNY